MFRDEAIKVMCNVVNEYNRQAILANPQPGLTSESIEEFIKQGADQLAHMNGLIYDSLKNHGVIN